MANLNSETTEKTATKTFNKISQFADNLPAVKEVKDAAMEEAEGLLQEARSFVKKNPIATVAAGIGVGFLLGMCLRKD